MCCLFVSRHQASFAFIKKIIKLSDRTAPHVRSYDAQNIQRNHTTSDYKSPRINVFPHSHSHSSFESSCSCLFHKISNKYCCYVAVEWVWVWVWVCGCLMYYVCVLYCMYLCSCVLLLLLLLFAVCDFVLSLQ